ncbi:hypothetical protein HME9302_01410 [Alteripontixanthobacter maritimus]|uniref:Multidrug transporter n=1 Tax=Alteripontixanthobacter maritimus TaxID=2161824 RepID=A0A369Q732_9SPHN|nr:SapC family protein [Alteripontixanthobacter maritimus]RDC60210.1 hypothetical protein HME9302_01410 [Alteripontixanthobacter maritimus]
MASAPQTQPQLPLFYNDLVPLNSKEHRGFHSRTVDSAPWLAKQHAIPLTADEFIQAQRHFPIVFSSGDNPLPLALMGLNEGVNTFLDDNGKITEPVYMPAYIRRYPWLLAKLTNDTDELSLCYDPTCEAIGDFKEGEPLFDDKGEASEATKGVLDFCEKFEQSGARTKQFMEELTSRELLMEGEVSIQAGGDDAKPFLYRGFQMVNQEKLNELDDETILTFHKNGILALCQAHLMSLDVMRSIFQRQLDQGKGPKADAKT